MTAPRDDGPNTTEPRPRHRPPWWPEGEPWPPPWRSGGPRGWGDGRRGGGWRRGFGCVFALLLLVLGSVVLVVLSTILGLLGVAGGSVSAIQVAALIVLVVAGFVLLGVGRVFRRTAGTLDDLADAAGRVERGDLAARVERPALGPRPVRELVRGFNAMAERLETDERQRRSLLADVSHELRTPLAVVQGNVEAMIDGVHPADQAHLAAVLDETRVIGRLVEDLRTVALSEAGTLPLHPEPTDLDVLLGDVVAAFATGAAQVGVALEIDAPSDLPILDVDPVRIREVVGNLVANALRYTPAGGRVIVAAQASGDRVEVRVTDTGAGMSEADLAHAFDRFWRSPDSRGSGLGLAIARNLVTAHGGAIEAESAPGRGTTVRFWLPHPD